MGVAVFGGDGINRNSLVCFVDEKNVKEEKEISKRVQSAKETIEKAEKQSDIPSGDEAKRRMKQYNDIYNEGGEGFVPYIISREEYESAKETVEKYANED